MTNSGIKKYHSSIGFLPCHVGEAKGLLSDLKYRRFSFSVHSLQELGQEREAVLIGRFIKDYQLNFDDVFEIAIYNGRIEKIGFRLNFGENDVIFILSREKEVITLWTNSAKDNHKTLNTNLYCHVSK